ncbi:MAG: Zn-ribbon domain-containing OB-fold protein [Conexivisphaerales archaeon]
MNSLLASKCMKCGRENFPPLKVCRSCGSRHMESIALPDRGILDSYTVLMVTASEFNGSAPIIIGLVRLENGLKVIGQVKGIRLEEIKEGMQMQLQVKQTEKNTKGVSYEFMPASSS